MSKNRRWLASQETLSAFLGLYNPNYLTLRSLLTSTHGVLFSRDPEECLRLINGHLVIRADSNKSVTPREVNQHATDECGPFAGTTVTRSRHEVACRQPRGIN